VMKYFSSPRIVDLSISITKRTVAKGGTVWLPCKKMSTQQVLEQKMEGNCLSRKQPRTA
jgi:dynactin 1